MPVFRISSYGIFVLSISCITFILYLLSSQRSIAISKSPVVSIRRLLTTSVHLIEKSGQLIVDFQANKEIRNHTKVSLEKEEIFTDADILSHQYLTNGFLKSLPGINIISEEKSEDYSNWESVELPSNEDLSIINRVDNKDLYLPLKDLTVWIDPLDATQEFSEGLLEYVTVMICVAFKDHPIIGIVNQPFKKKTFWSWEHFGVSEDLEELYNKSKTQPISQGPLNVTMSRSHLWPSVEKNLIDSFPDPLNIIRSGGSGYKVLKVIENAANLYIHPETIKKWDICAPNALLNAVGGGLYSIDPFHEPIDYSYTSQNYIRRKTGIFGVASEETSNKYAESIKKFLTQYQF